MPNILLLEDSPDMQFMMKSLLEMEGYKVLCLNNGREGLHFLSKARILPDVIITDMYMPEMDGLAFLKAVRGNAEWARVRVVMLSAESNEVDAARKNGANAYMLKPLDMDHFNKVLRKWGLIG